MGSSAEVITLMDAQTNTVQTVPALWITAAVVCPAQTIRMKVRCKDFINVFMCELSMSWPEVTLLLITLVLEHLNRHLSEATVETGIGALYFFSCAPLAFVYLASQGSRFSTDYAIAYAVCGIW